MSFDNETRWKVQHTSFSQIMKLWNKDMPWLWAVCSSLYPGLLTTVIRIKHRHSLVNVLIGTRYIHATNTVGFESVWPVPDGAVSLEQMIQKFLEVADQKTWTIKHLVGCDLAERRVVIYSLDRSVKSFLELPDTDN